MAKAYVEEQGYEVVSYVGDQTSSFEKADLLAAPVRDTWEVQTVLPDAYIVRDHPLGQANVFVMMLDGEIIGGTSFPDSSEPLMGSSHSLDGKTAEDLHPDDYWEWRKDWDQKYSE